MNGSGRVALALLLALLGGFTGGTQGQVVSAKVMRSSNVRQHGESQFLMCAFVLYERTVTSVSTTKQLVFWPDWL